MASSLVLTALDNIPTIGRGDDLAAIILNAASQQGLMLQQGDIIVLAQKIVSKAEGRFVRLSDVTPSDKARDIAIQTHKDPRIVELVLRESVRVVRATPKALIVENQHGLILANAGIDASNVETDKSGEETVLLLPKNPDASASALRASLLSQTGLELGILVNDSLGRPWRLGTVGTAIGVAGMPGMIDMRGRKDRNGRKLMATELGVADELAAAASLLMGQAGEGRPVIHIRGFPHALRAGTSRELLRARDMDLFQ